MKLLAVDQGSQVLGAAYFDAGRPVSLDRLQARAGDWLTRMESIAAELRQCPHGRGWDPDVVAIEDVMLGINANCLAVMGETRGYLTAWSRYIWPRVRILDVHPSMAAAIGGGGRGTDERKAATMAFALTVLDRHGVARPVGGLDQALPGP